MELSMFFNETLVITQQQLVRRDVLDRQSCKYPVWNMTARTKANTTTATTTSDGPGLCARAYHVLERARKIQPNVKYGSFTKLQTTEIPLTMMTATGNTNSDIKLSGLFVRPSWLKLFST